MGRRVGIEKRGVFLLSETEVGPGGQPWIAGLEKISVLPDVIRPDQTWGFPLIDKK